MGEMLEELINAEVDDQANPWIAPGGLSLQQAAADSAWDDPELDVYNEE